MCESINQIMKMVIIITTMWRCCFISVPMTWKVKVWCWSAGRRCDNRPNDLQLVIISCVIRSTTTILYSLMWQISPKPSPAAKSLWLWKKIPNQNLEIDFVYLCLIWPCQWCNCIIHGVGHVSTDASSTGNWEFSLHFYNSCIRCYNSQTWMNACRLKIKTFWSAKSSWSPPLGPLIKIEDKGMRMVILKLYLPHFIWTHFSGSWPCQCWWENPWVHLWFETQQVNLALSLFLSGNDYYAALGEVTTSYQELEFVP